MAFDCKWFLRPSWKKAAVAALLFFLFVPFITYWNGIMCFRAPCPSDSTGSVLMFLLTAPNHLIYQVYYLNALAGAFVCYAISCFLAGRCFAPKTARK